LESEKKTTGKPIPKEALDSFSRELFGKVQPLREKIDELLIVDKNAIRETQFLERLLHIYIWVAIISSVLGLAMTTLGFSLWHVRVQRFLDRDLKQNESGGC
jgi:hypothetical protein